MVIKECCRSPRSLLIRALPEGAWFRPWETVMIIEGPYQKFAHLETVYLGILARRSGVATAVRKIALAAHEKPVLFFAARFDHPVNQEGDGYAAVVGGAAGVSTDAGGQWSGKSGIGTIPHALIAAFNGDTIKASVAFDRYVPESVQRIALVDFDNDCPATSVAVAQALGSRLWGVRLDTSEQLVDKSLARKGMQKKGVCPELVWEVRRSLDGAGFPNVKIVVSGGFTLGRVRQFIKGNVPCDSFGIGSYFFRHRLDFTADVVMVNDKLIAKVGRSYKPNPRLVEY